MNQTMQVPQQRASSIADGVEVLGCVAVNDQTCGGPHPVEIHQELNPRYVVPGRCQGNRVLVTSEAGIPTAFYHLVAVSPQPLEPNAVALLPADRPYLLELVYNHHSCRLSWRVARHDD